MKTITVAGNLGRDAEVRTTQKGDKVTGFSVAVEDRSSGNKETMWFDVSIWGKRGETLSQYLTKGTKVCIAGDLSTRAHEGRTYLQIRADQVTLLGGGQDRGSAPASSHQQTTPADMDDAIPFAPEWRA